MEEMDYSALRQRLGFAITPRPRVRLDLIRPVKRLSVAVAAPTPIPAAPTTKPAAACWPPQPEPVFYDEAPDHSALTAHKIVTAVCMEFGVTKEQLRSLSRKRPVTLARRKACHRMRYELKIGGRQPTLSEIARILGGLDHSSVFHAIRAYERDAGSVQK